MVVIGGLTSVGGAVVGAVVLRGAQYLFGGGLQLVVTGSGVLLLLLVFPGGLGQLVQNARDALLRRLAERRGLEVPSLVADRRMGEEDASERPRLDQLLAGDSALAWSAAGANGDGDEVERLQLEAAELRRRLDDLEVLVGKEDRP